MDELRVRIKERLRVYGSAPDGAGANITDLVMVMEDMLEMLGDGKKVGFNA